MQAAEFLFSPQNETVLVCSVSSVCVRMRMKIYSWLLVFILGCNVSAEKKQKIIRQKDSITLPCPHPVEGKVTWSRETNGNRVDIHTVDGERDIRHIHDPLKRYSSSADKSLHISRAVVSDAGTYFCNNEAAVELTVLPGRKEPTTTTTTPPPLTRQTTSEPLPAATTAPSTPLVNTDRRLLHGVWFGIGIVLLVLLLLLIVLFTRRYRSKRRGNEGGHHVYDDIQMNGLVSQTTNNGSSQNSPMYAYMIHNRPQTGNNTETPLTNEPLYSLIWHPKARYR
ncbi:uncharacterized protein LOC119907982 isoform X1 [Micropterus salmoides]|uniref:uncharacterized protein LOC119907982 isoform X1 n=1 Tax=Micropterus salmoides TaxID=27706 RepID=UPI0018ED6147|nr:uncharacterized protein LOC119907982 isoform X1 [Micropterus salmoides]